MVFGNKNIFLKLAVLSVYRRQTCYSKKNNFENVGNRKKHKNDLKTKSQKMAFCNISFLGAKHEIVE